MHICTCSYTLTKAPFNSTRQPGNNFSSFYFFGYIFISVCVTVRACVCVLVCVRCSIPKHSVLAFDANSVSAPQWRRRRVVSFARRRGLCAALRRRRRRHWVDVCGCDAAAAAAFVYLFAVRSLGCCSIFIAFRFSSRPVGRTVAASHYFQCFACTRLERNAAAAVAAVATTRSLYSARQINTNRTYDTRSTRECAERAADEVLIRFL